MTMSSIEKNRFKWTKEIEPSTNIADLVPVDSKWDVNVIDSIEKTIVAVGHSTPIKLDTSTPQDLSNVDYHSSLCTQTQDGGVEVTWDWHSPGRKPIGLNGKNKTNEVNTGGTPKRTTMIHKKRISNSPLMYKPLKRKFIKHENTEDIDKFKADLMALSEKLKNEGEDGQMGINKSEDDENADILGEIEFDDFNDDIDDHVVGNDNQKPLQDGGDDKNLDDLFDDSLNDTMIRCSQEIEERLNIAPIKLKGKDTCTNYKSKKSLDYHTPYSSTKNLNQNKFNNKLNQTKSNVNYPNTTIDRTNIIKPTIMKQISNFTHSKTNVVDSTRNSVKSMRTKASSDVTAVRHQSTSTLNKGETNLNSQNTDVLSIPDDSFDEFIATCDEDFSHLNNYTLTRSNHCRKTYENVHSISPKKSVSHLPRGITKSSTSVLLNSMSNVSKSNVFKTNQSAGNNSAGNLGVQSNKMTSDLDSTSTLNRNWKFFKSKSHSDSSFTSNKSTDASNSKVGNQPCPQYVFDGGSKLNVNSKSSSRVSSGSSVSIEHEIAPIRRTTSCLDSNTMSKNNIRKDNIQTMYNVNRYVGRKDGNDRDKNKTIQNAGDVASGIQSLQLCSPEEIERKRLEARMKLEAKKKREQKRSDSGVILSYVPSIKQSNR